jgi:predicted kinase
VRHGIENTETCRHDPITATRMTLYVVTGPPCVGKSTWVKERAKTGDIVVDLDRLALAITAEHTPHHEYPAHIRKAAIQIRKTAVACALAYSRKGDSYIIHAKPTQTANRAYAKHQARIVELHASWPVLMERAKAERPAHIWKTLATWWDEPEE